MAITPETKTIVGLLILAASMFGLNVYGAFKRKEGAADQKVDDVAKAEHDAVKVEREKTAVETAAELYKDITGERE